MEAFLQMLAVTSDANIMKIRMIYNNIEANVRDPEVPSIASEMYGSSLVPLKMNKLPEQLRLIITQHSEGGTCHIDKLLKTFKEEEEA